MHKLRGRNKGARGMHTHPAWTEKPPTGTGRPVDTKKPGGGAPPASPLDWPAQRLQPQIRERLRRRPRSAIAGGPSENVHRHAKFHPQSPGKAALPTVNSGCDSEPLTADLGAMSTPGARAATNDLICSLVPGSCLPGQATNGDTPRVEARSADDNTAQPSTREVSGELRC